MTSLQHFSNSIAHFEVIHQLGTFWSFGETFLRAHEEQVLVHTAHNRTGNWVANLLPFEARFQHGSGCDDVLVGLGLSEAFVQQITYHRLPFGRILNGVHEHRGHLVPLDHSIRV